MTYRDYALYNDLKIRNLWFPVANLMPHGIIKGRLEGISKDGEPFDRFTNNAVLYFARGVTMWELYISPDILTDKEWQVLSQAIKWANDKQEVMAQTFMQGGNPALGESYAYIHFKNKKGVIAARNPKIEKNTLHIKLIPEQTKLFRKYPSLPTEKNLKLQPKVSKINGNGTARKYLPYKKKSP